MTMDYEQIAVETSDSVLTITLDPGWSTPEFE